MPKRKRDPDELEKRIQRYQERLERWRKEPQRTPSEPSASPTPQEISCQSLRITGDEVYDDIQEMETSIQEQDPEGEALDADILEVLGDAPNVKKYGPAIHKDLATRWIDVIKKGLPKDKRTEIKNKYLPPENCKTVDAPRLNLEAQAAITDIAVKRDKALAAKQSQVGCAITALARAFGSLIKTGKENIQTINYISDAARLLCDLQHQESITRRNFVLQGLEPSIREAVKDAEVDEWLFGESFADKLKASKAIKKSGLEISVSKNKKPQQQQPKKPLNLRGPTGYQTPSLAYQAGPRRSYPHKKPPTFRAQQAVQPQKTLSKAPARATSNRV